MGAGSGRRQSSTAAMSSAVWSGLPRIFRTVELGYFMLRPAGLDIRCGPRTGFGSLTLSEAAADYRRFQYSGQYLVSLCSGSDKRCVPPAHFLGCEKGFGQCIIVTTPGTA